MENSQFNKQLGLVRSEIMFPTEWEYDYRQVQVKYAELMNRYKHLEKANAMLVDEATKKLSKDEIKTLVYNYQRDSLVRSHEDEIREQEEKIVLLTKENADIKNTLQEKQVELGIIQDQFDADEELQKTIGKVKTLKAEVARWHQKKEQLERESRKFDENVQKAEAYLAAMKKAVEDLLVERKQLIQDVKELRSEKVRLTPRTGILGGRI